MLNNMLIDLNQHVNYVNICVKRLVRPFKRSFTKLSQMLLLRRLGILMPLGKTFLIDFVGLAFCFVIAMAFNRT